MSQGFKHTNLTEEKIVFAPLLWMWTYVPQLEKTRIKSFAHMIAEIKFKKLSLGVKCSENDGWNSTSTEESSQEAPTPDFKYLKPLF